VIIETKEAIDNIEAIAAVPGLDVMFMGLYDLCLSYGLNPNEMPFAEIDERIQRVLAAGKAHGVSVGTGVGAAEDISKRCDEGFRFISFGTDYFMLNGAAQAGLEAFRKRS